jgi:hypothetical protein
VKSVRWCMFPVVFGICVIMAAVREPGNESAVLHAMEPVQHPAESRANPLKLPGPDVQNLMLGTWSISTDYAPSEEMPHGGTGKGREIWRPGPGNRSVIEELHEKNPSGELDGFAVGWWDEKAQGQRYVWCDNNEKQGCYVSKNVARWDGNRLVYSEDVEEHGKSLTRQEIFSDITPTSFLQVIQEGAVGGDLRPIVTIHATKLPETSGKP